MPMIPVRQRGSLGVGKRDGIGELVCDGLGILDGGGLNSGITQGGGSTLQSRPEARILVTQQL